MSVAQEMRARSVPPQFRYFKPAGARATQYEEVTLHSQWDPKNYAKQGWFCRHADGRPVWDPNSTRLTCTDWWSYRDPAQMWFRPYVEHQARQEQAIELAMSGARRSDLVQEIEPSWRDLLARHYAAYRFFEYGLFLSLSYAQREALSDVVATPIVFQGLDKDRHAQDIALLTMDLEEALPDFSATGSKEVWLQDPIWQPAREMVELLLACRDWGEITFAINLAVEPLVSTIFTRELVARQAPRNGDSATALVMHTVENDRVQAFNASSALVRFLVADTPTNQAVVQEWLNIWASRAARAAKALEPLFVNGPNGSGGFDMAWNRVFGEWRAMLAELGLSAPING